MWCLHGGRELSIALKGCFRVAVNVVLNAPVCRVPLVRSEGDLKLTLYLPSIRVTLMFVAPMMDVNCSLSFTIQAALLVNFPDIG
jgi:hypothetical protein